MVRNDGKTPKTFQKRPQLGDCGERNASSASPQVAKASGSQRGASLVDSEAGCDCGAAGDCGKDGGDEVGDDGDDADDLDLMQFDPNVRDILGDFGLDDDEALPEEGDFWFDDARDFDE